jgi:hypothetical protein
MWRTIIIIFTTSLLGFSIGFGIANAVLNGSFNVWKPLGRPPGKATAIVDGYGSTVVIKTEDGKLYRSSSTGWVEIAPPLEKSIGWQFDCSGLPEPPTPPGKVIAVEKGTTYCLEDRNQYYYILLEDNTIWMWNYSISMLGAAFILRIYPLLGLFTGFLIGVAITIALWMYSLGRSRIHGKE